MGRSETEILSRGSSSSSYGSIRDDRDNQAEAANRDQEDEVEVRGGGSSVRSSLCRIELVETEY